MLDRNSQMRVVAAVLLMTHAEVRHSRNPICPRRHIVKLINFQDPLPLHQAHSVRETSVLETSVVTVNSTDSSVRVVLLLVAPPAALLRQAVAPAWLPLQSSESFLSNCGEEYHKYKYHGFDGDMYTSGINRLMLCHESSTVFSLNESRW